MFATFTIHSQYKRNLETDPQHRIHTRKLKLVSNLKNGFSNTDKRSTVQLYHENKPAHQFRPEPQHRIHIRNRILANDFVLKF
jgi:hypothetical protein